MEAGVAGMTSARPGSGMEEVRGQLAPGILPDVLRHVAFLRASGRVDVRFEPPGAEAGAFVPHAAGAHASEAPGFASPRSGSHYGWIELRDGQPVHAVCRRSDAEQTQGLEALATMLAWRQGSYLFEMHEAVPADREVARDQDRIPDPGANGSARALASVADVHGASSLHGMSGRTLVGSTEAVLEAAQVWGARRNGVHAKDPPDPARPGGDPSVTEPLAAERASGWPDVVSPPRGAADSAARTASPSADEIASPPDAPRIRAASTLLRASGVADDAPVIVTHGALEVWRRLDGVATLADLAASLGQHIDAVRSRADELLVAGIARVAPQPIYGQAFVADLVGALNEIMGPMGEILVEDALFDLHLDPRAIPRDRIDDLTTALARQLHRSDWQLKLRARVARLVAETPAETWADARLERASPPGTDPRTEDTR